MTKKEQIKKYIEDSTGLKVSIRKASIKSSMRGYIIFSSKKTKGVYPSWTFEFSQKMIREYKGTEDNPTFCDRDRFSLYFGNEAYNE